MMGSLVLNYHLSSTIQLFLLFHETVVIDPLEVPKRLHWITAWKYKFRYIRKKVIMFELILIRVRYHKETLQNLTIFS